jgi:hypothetical protein
MEVIKKTNSDGFILVYIINDSRNIIKLRKYLKDS